MHGKHGVHDRIQLRHEGAQELRIRPLHHCCQIIRLARHRTVLRHNEPAEHVEVLVITARHPQSLGLSKKSRSIIRSDVKSLIVIGYSCRIIVHRHLKVTQSRQYIWRRISAVVLLERSHCLILSSGLLEKIETENGYGLGHTEDSLDLLKGLESLIRLTLSGIQIDHIIIKLAFVRKIIQELFIHIHSQLLTGCRTIKPGQTIAVPEVPAVKTAGLPETSFGLVDVIHAKSHKRRPVPRGIIVRSFGDDSVKNGRRTLEIPFIIQGNCRDDVVFASRCQVFFLSRKRGAGEKQNQGRYKYMYPMHIHLRFIEFVQK